MNDTILGALIGVGGAALGGIVTGFFSIFQDWKQRRHEQSSLRTLLSLEILQNLTALRTLRAALASTLDYDDSWRVAVAFVVTASPPQWQTTRWRMPETGRYLSSSQLMRLGEWYTKLGSVTLLYQRLLTQLQHLQTTDGRFRMNNDVGDDAKRQILAIIKYAAGLQDNPPPLPDEKLNRGETIRDYLVDLQQRQPETANLTGASK